MSTLGRVGVSVPGPSEMPLDTGAIRVRKLEQKSDAAPQRDSVAVNGVTDATRPKGSPLTDGITLAAGASIDVAHGLGRVPIGFQAIVSGGPVGVLQNNSASLAKDMKTKVLRVQNSGGAPVTFRLQVF